MPGTYVENYQRVLKDKGRPAGTQWSFICPFPGCIGYSKRKFFVDPSKGYWQCKHCSHDVPDKTYREDCKEASGGTWREFVDLVGDDPSLWPNGTMSDHNLKIRQLTGKQRRKIWTNMFELGSLTTEDYIRVAARGIDPIKVGVVSATSYLFEKIIELHGEDTTIRAGLAYQTKDGLHPRTCITPGRILIPYYDGSEVFYFVGYMKCPSRKPEQSIEEYQVIKSDWKKIASPAGYTPAIYGGVPNNSPYIIITEGQFKAEAARQKGFPCIGLQGIMNAHASIVKQCVAKKVKKAIILFDTQLEDQENVDWAAEKLAREFLKVGITPFKA
ncbi:MAG TPA: DUF3854 domain-containing protein, partial [Methylomirabilota bacterium]|nr:DUF3854 domain-containing protein [Methylomirabilota bacterium]